MTNSSNAPRRMSVAACLLSVLALGSACRQDMHDAPRYDPLEYSPIFANGASARPLVEGTVARGALNGDELLATGKLNGQLATVFPFAITRADLDRGEQRFNVYCTPCHGATGEGNGMVVQRGYRQPPSYHIDRLRQAPVGHFVDVMTNGFGVMPDYRAQVVPADRWRIAAYLRVLQLSQHATAADLPPGEFDKVAASVTAAAEADVAAAAQAATPAEH